MVCLKAKEHLKRDLFYLVHDVAHLMRIRFDQYARAFGMTRAQCVILMHVKMHPGMTQSEMASHCEIEPITVARLIDRLQASGLVERRTDPSDRRINRLHLLPAALPILEQISTSRECALRYMTRDIDPAQKEAAISVLQQMKDKLLSPETIFQDEQANLPKTLKE